MITFIQAILLPKIPPTPSGIGGPGPPGLPTLPIDDGLIFMFFAAIIFGTYIHCKKIMKTEKVNAKSSQN
jgi:hypothetical protein